MRDDDVKEGMGIRIDELESQLAAAQERIAALESALSEAQLEMNEARAHARNHHLEACETCAANESEVLDLRTQLAAAVVEEREACAKAICALCASVGSNHPLRWDAARLENGQWVHRASEDRELCRAAAIRARGKGRCVSAAMLEVTNENVS